MAGAGTDMVGTTGMKRFVLMSATGVNHYIIEGPRVPVDWEIDGLVDAYNHARPRGKKQLGNFSISQSFKPADRDLTPLSYRSKE
jgi:hypothetical protein